MGIAVANPLEASKDPRAGGALPPPVPAWNDTAREVAEATWPELFQEQVRRVPDAPAVVSGGGAVSYAELNARANRLARFLVSRGAGPEGLVAIAMPRSVEMVVAVLAVLKAGAGYVPVDLAYPSDRISYMLAEACPVAVLTTIVAGRDLPDGPPRRRSLGWTALTWPPVSGPLCCGRPARPT
jgi:non-ribosomal peptide synthetase component F